MIIPINELTISPTIADISQVVPEENTGTWDDITIPYTTATFFDQEPVPGVSSAEQTYSIIGGDDVKVFATGNTTWYIFSKSPAILRVTNKKTQSHSDDPIYLSVETIVSGTTVYYYRSTGSIRLEGMTPAPPMFDYHLETYQQMATVLYDGEQTHQEGGQTITVSWPRHGDGLVLTDTFTIQVSSDDESQGENS